MRTINSTDPVTYVPNFLDYMERHVVYDTLRQHIDWERRPDAPRSEYWTNTYWRDYTYGRGAGLRTYQAKPMHPVIHKVNVLIQQFVGGELFEGCFLNMYETSRDSLGWHADDDPGIDHERPIAVVTLGAGRPLRIRPIADLKDIAEVNLEPGSLLMMHAGMQATHHHCIPKVGHDIGPRISMTYRGLLADGS